MPIKHWDGKIFFKKLTLPTEQKQKPKPKANNQYKDVENKIFCKTNIVLVLT